MIKTLLLAFGIVLSLSTSTIFTPLWLDSINASKNQSNRENGRNSSTQSTIDNYNIILIVGVLNFVLSLCVLLIYSLFFSGIKVLCCRASDGHSKKDLFFIGFCDAVSSILLVFAGNGTRTPPSLQAIATNFAIPATFLIRFIILRKKPSCYKATFAFFVFCGEILALIPSIFPQLESSSSKKEDGGATGTAGILWPLCYFAGFIPQAIVNVVFEKTAQANVQSLDKQDNDETDDGTTLHTLNIMFWSYLFCLLSLILLCWTDLIPEFGSADGINNFWSKLNFNVKCFIGVDQCPTQTHLYSGVVIGAMLVNRLLCILFLRITEGASYLIIINSLQTPVVLLFWTLFDEQPLSWHPHAHLSTWLSIGAVCIMLPSIYFYNKSRSPVNTTDKNFSDIDETHPLIYNMRAADSYESIDASSMSVFTSSGHKNVKRNHSLQFGAINSTGMF